MLLEVWWYSLQCLPRVGLAFGSTNGRGENRGEGLGGGRGGVGRRRLWGPRVHPCWVRPPRPCLCLAWAWQSSAASCVLPWNSHYVTGIQYWPVMKLQTAGSSLTHVTQEGKPLFWILALEHLPGLSARALSPGAFPNCLGAPCFPWEGAPPLTLSPHPSIKSPISTKKEQDLG